MQVLLIKMSSLGDVLHTLPALTDAAYALPGIIFDWVVEENYSEIPTWHPAVRKVILVAIRRWRKHWFNIATYYEINNLKIFLQQEQYNVIIDAQGLIKSALLLTLIAQHHEKHGLDYNSAREPFASWFYQQRHAVRKQQHAIERIRQLFADSLNYPLPTSTGDYAIASNFAQPISADPYVVFLHATTKSSKKWPESHWSALIKLANDAGYRIKVPWGTEHEHQRAIRITAGLAKAEVLPPLSLTQIAQLLVGATAVVSVDTGISHLAAALNRPNLTLYGPTDPKLIGGYGQYQQAIRAHDSKMASLSTQYVWQSFQPMLSLL